MRKVTMNGQRSREREKMGRVEQQEREREENLFNPKKKRKRE